MNLDRATLNHPEAIPLERFEHELEDINKRIAVLARVMRQRLDLPGLVDHLLLAHGEPPRHIEARELIGHEELRGLLVLRYKMLTNAVEQLGLEPTRRVSELVTRHLEMEHTPGADYGLASYATILAGESSGQ